MFQWSNLNLNLSLWYILGFLEAWNFVKRLNSIKTHKETLSDLLSSIIKFPFVHFSLLVHNDIKLNLY